MANKSHGSQATAEVSDTVNALLVRDATNSGAAMVANPLPRADNVLAAHSFVNRPSNEAVDSPDTRPTYIKPTSRPWRGGDFWLGLPCGDVGVT
jgi:hypothetical protein